MMEDSSSETEDTDHNPDNAGSNPESHKQLQDNEQTSTETVKANRRPSQEMLNMSGVPYGRASYSLPSDDELKSWRLERDTLNEGYKPLPSLLESGISSFRIPKIKKSEAKTVSKAESSKSSVVSKTISTLKLPSSSSLSSSFTSQLTSSHHRPYAYPGRTISYSEAAAKLSQLVIRGQLRSITYHRHILLRV